MIITKTRNGKKCYYTEERTNKLEQIPGLNLNVPTKNQRAILLIICDNPGITKKELVKKTRINKQSVTYSIKRLIDQKIVWTVRSGRETGYEYITKEKLKGKLLNLLLEKFLNGEIGEEKFFALKEKLEN